MFSHSQARGLRCTQQIQSMNDNYMEDFISDLLYRTAFAKRLGLSIANSKRELSNNMIDYTCSMCMALKTASDVNSHPEMDFDTYIH